MAALEAPEEANGANGQLTTASSKASSQSEWLLSVTYPKGESEINPDSIREYALRPVSKR